MKFLKNNLYTLFTLALVFTMALAGDASADSVFTTAVQKGRITFQAVKTVIFVIGGFGLIGLGFQAIFGKVKWPWFAGLAFGLAVVAAAGAVVDYATGSATGEETGMGDTFTDVQR